MKEMSKIKFPVIAEDVIQSQSTYFTFVKSRV